MILRLKDVDSMLDEVDYLCSILFLLHRDNQYDWKRRPRFGLLIHIWIRDYSFILCDGWDQNDIFYCLLDTELLLMI